MHPATQRIRLAVFVVSVLSTLSIIQRFQIWQLQTSLEALTHTRCGQDVSRAAQSAPHGSASSFAEESSQSRSGLFLEAAAAAVDGQGGLNSSSQAFSPEQSELNNLARERPSPLARAVPAHLSDFITETLAAWVMPLKDCVPACVDGVCNRDTGLCDCPPGKEGPLCENVTWHGLPACSLKDMNEQGVRRPWASCRGELPLSSCPNFCSRRGYCNRTLEHLEPPSNNINDKGGGDESGIDDDDDMDGIEKEEDVEDGHEGREGKTGGGASKGKDWYTPPPKGRCICNACSLGDSCEDYRPEYCCFPGCQPPRGTCDRGFCRCRPGYWGVDCTLSHDASARHSRYRPLADWPSDEEYSTIRARIEAGAAAFNMARKDGPPIVRRSRRQVIPPVLLGGNVGPAAGVAAGANGSSNGSEAAAVPPLHPARGISPRIYVYPLPAALTLHKFQWPSDRVLMGHGRSDLYITDRLFHRSLMASRYRVDDPRIAQLFYVPVWFPFGPWGPWNTSYEPALEHIQMHYPFWARRGGRDHLFFAHQDTGSCAAPEEFVGGSLFITLWGGRTNINGRRLPGCFQEGTVGQASRPALQPWLIGGRTYDGTMRLRERGLGLVGPGGGETGQGLAVGSSVGMNNKNLGGGGGGGGINAGGGGDGSNAGGDSFGIVPSGTGDPIGMGTGLGSGSPAKLLRQVVAPPALWYDLARSPMVPMEYRDEAEWEEMRQEARSHGAEQWEVRGVRKKRVFFAGRICWHRQMAHAQPAPKERGPCDNDTYYEAYSFGVRKQFYDLYRHHPSFLILDIGVPATSRRDHWQRSNGMLTSTFCFSPHGIGWGVRVYEAVVAGCIPIVIMDDGVNPPVELAFEEIIPWDDFAVRLPRADINRIPELVLDMPDAEVAARQKAMAQHWRRLVWNNNARWPPAMRFKGSRGGGVGGVEQGGDPPDAFESIMEVIRLRFQALGGLDR
eukprot:jgi/Mesvir1/26454/Mv16129-RA.2